MPHITASDPRLAAPKQTTLSQSTQQAGTFRTPSVNAPAKKDSVHFGSSVQFGSSDEEHLKAPKDAKKDSFLQTTPVIKNIVAGFKNGFHEFKKGPWYSYFGGGVLVTILTLPIHGWIPGPQPLVVMGYMLAKRAWNGTKGFLHGLKHPEKVFKPEANTEPEEI